MSMPDYAIMLSYRPQTLVLRPAVKFLISQLTLCPEHRQTMLDHVQRLWPEEACGILAGPGQQVERVYLIENAHHSPTDYYMDPMQQINAMLEIEAAGWDISAIFHSHPSGPARPSATDIDRALYPDAVYLILAPDGGQAWSIQGFEIRDGQARDVPIQIRS